MTDGVLRDYRREFYGLSYVSDIVEMVAFAAAIAVGVFYLWLELKTLGKVSDWAFIVILVGATSILLFAERYIQKEFLNGGLRFLAYSLGLPLGLELVRAHREITGPLYSSRNRIISGIGYGLVLATAPYFLSVWPMHRALQVLLATFLFLVNYTTGNAMYGLVRFLLNSKTLARLIKLDLWNTRNPSTEFYIRHLLTLGFFASAYVSVSMTSILFSAFDRAFIVYVYVAFSFTVLFVTLVYPYLPIVRAAISAKHQFLARLGARLEISTRNALEHVGTPDFERILAEMHQLLELRKTVEMVDVVPFRRLSVVVVTVMAFIFSHPFILEWAIALEPLRRLVGVQGH